VTDNILIKIPGEILGSAGYSLPAAESLTENTQRLIVRLPDGTRAEVTFVNFKKGKIMFWALDSAKILSDNE
jgi:hypothetical protein